MNGVPIYKRNINNARRGQVTYKHEISVYTDKGNTSFLQKYISVNIKMHYV